LNLTGSNVARQGEAKPRRRALIIGAAAVVIAGMALAAGLLFAQRPAQEQQLIVSEGHGAQPPQAEEAADMDALITNADEAEGLPVLRFASRQYTAQPHACYGYGAQALIDELSFFEWHYTETHGNPNASGLENGVLDVAADEGVSITPVRRFYDDGTVLFMVFDNMKMGLEPRGEAEYQMRQIPGGWAAVVPSGAQVETGGRFEDIWLVYCIDASGVLTEDAAVLEADEWMVISNTNVYTPQQACSDIGG